MKLISFAVPSYNSQDYMRKCIESLLPGGEDVEIIIVDDGSKDDTAKIADEYAEKYPTIVRAIHQENGGHGEAVNTGLRNAKGLYYKVVDSDDWLDAEAYPRVLKRLKELVDAGRPVDLFICNYMYDKVGQRHKKVIRYGNAMPKEKVFHFKDMGHFCIGQYILMHSVIYRTNLLRKCNLALPKHTFYVDNIYVYNPFPYVKSVYYMNENLYHYYIGREDQSVNEKVMIGRIDQQLKVTRLMIDSYKLSDPSIANKRCRSYMKNYLEVMMSVSSILAIRSHDEENLRKKAELWDYLKEKDPITYKKIRYGAMGIAMNLPGRCGRKVSEILYKIARKIFGFN